MKIKWTNRFSNEQGYVKEVAGDHFVNTFDEKESANYRTRREAEKAIDFLFACGEGLNNTFEVVTVKRCRA